MLSQIYNILCENLRFVKMYCESLIDRLQLSMNGIVHQVPEKTN